ncbi:hypothetical protein Patl1_29757 [Pistacia atlantica]|uniref:Uncharacterized protein n=1 Tax=Pistacia atlantica TaxID=434234 RepID=A0ACC1AD72_9ROSI|nr:hypothetical protein Patl1_29757 [Pistacia atlantica]
MDLGLKVLLIWQLWLVLFPVSTQKRSYMIHPLSLAPPDIDKLNAAYLSIHGSAILGQPMGLKTSSLTPQA